jgi:hypothetical protein
MDFDAAVAEVTGLLDRHAVMVVATSAAGRVTARSVSTIHRGLVVYFQTATDSQKYAQIQANPNVALCAGNVQIEGSACDLGHPLAEQNGFFAEAYAREHPGSFCTYSRLARNRVIAVTPRRVSLWKYDEANRPYQDFVDLDARRTWREIYPIEA